jgi:hypothetical protein
MEWNRPADAVRAARRGITALGGDKMLQNIVARGGKMVEKPAGGA